MMAPTAKLNLPDRQAIKRDSDATAEIKATERCSVFPIRRIRNARRKHWINGSESATSKPALADLLAVRHASIAPADNSTTHGAIMAVVRVLETAAAIPATKNAIAT